MTSNTLYTAITIYNLQKKSFRIFYLFPGSYFHLEDIKQRDKIFIYRF